MVDLFTSFIKIYGNLMLLDLIYWKLYQNVIVESWRWRQSFVSFWKKIF